MPAKTILSLKKLVRLNYAIAREDRRQGWLNSVVVRAWGL